MNGSEITYKFIDYIILSSYSLKSPGLYNGKVGIALCLFEGARCFHDNFLEEQAFELIQESIILSQKIENYSFGSGAAGVGFVLLYLLENQFLEGEFSELFDDQLLKILSEINRKPFLSMRQPSLIYFLFLVNKTKNDKDKIQSIINNILSTTESTLGEHFLYFNKMNSGIDKLSVLRLFADYLKIICCIDEYNRSLPIIEAYSQLYDKWKISCNFKIGFYLKRIGENLNNDYLKQIAIINQTAYINTMRLETMTLEERIRLLYLISEENSSNFYHHIIDVLEKDLFHVTLDQLEKKIPRMIPSHFFISGYKSGISRFLLYCFYKKYKQSREDCSRFSYLF